MSRSRAFAVGEILYALGAVALVVLAASVKTDGYVANILMQAATYAIAVFGTGVSDTLHLTVGIPYAGTSALWAVVLAGIFVVWYRSERTLSIHSITTRRREGFYWSTVFATFALGTALGDFTATALHLGYLASGFLFLGVILIPALFWWRFGLNPVVAFWFAYVVTRPLGASFADYFSKPHSLSGAGYGDGIVALITTIIVAILVGYLAMTRCDIQPPERQEPGRPETVRNGVAGR